ncbi:glycine oxidase ThiO [Rhizobium sp. PAMB 3182]
MRILIKGAGVAGLTAAHALVRRGHDVTIAEKQAAIGLGASHFAGGMLAPWCEGESADRQVVEAGTMSLEWWGQAVPDVVGRNGTLVVAQPRDNAELDRFASRTSHFEPVGEEEIARLEPALAGRFRRGLFFPGEAHVDPRAALAGLYQRLRASGAIFRFESPSYPDSGFDRVIDCTGAARIGATSRLRGVRGEMLYLRTEEVSLSRPVRLLHPRIPLYVAPQPGHRFMVGATMIESDREGPVTARSVMELLNAAYALHPAFGEADLIETGSGVRPAYDDNIPRISGAGRHFSINGMYRHGFLMAPYLAETLAAGIESSQPAMEVSA